MRLRCLLSLGAVLALVSPAMTAAPVPREAPVLTVTNVTGEKQELSRKGDVVVIEFMLMRCAGCLKMAATINKLYGEMGNRGLRPVSVVFDNGVSAPVVRELSQLLKLNYPVGYATSQDVDRYLSRAAEERIQVPQLVVIDRAGIIRAQSSATGEKGLTDEIALRYLLGQLLDEPAPAAAK